MNGVDIRFFITYDQNSEKNSDLAFIHTTDPVFAKRFSLVL